MSKVITADTGNSNIVLGLFDGDSLLFTDRLETRRIWTPQSMAFELTRILASDSIDPKSIEGSIISSVVPEVDPVLKSALLQVTGREAIQMNTSLKTGIGTKLYDTSNFGQDRLVDMAAAIAFYGTPVAVYDLGTCTTLSVTDRSANFIGGMISAGVQLSLDVQADRTAKLPQLTAEPAESLLGRDTISNMISGAVASTGIMMDGVIKRIREEYNLPDLKVIVTGGNSRYVIPWICEKVIHDPDLLLKGLLTVYRMNH